MSRGQILCAKFDEALNKSTQTSERDVLVRYFGKSDKRIHTKYVSSAVLGHATLCRWTCLKMLVLRMQSLKGN